MIAEIVLLDDVCSVPECMKEVQKLSEELEGYRRKISDKNKKYFELTSLNLKKDVIIRQLEIEKKSSIFNEFGEVLSETAINDLISIENVAKKDSYFILNVMRDVYRNDIERLQNKTYSGRKKEPLTPQKVKLIENIFKKRLNNQENCNERFGNLRKHIKTAIETINIKNK